MKKICMFFLLLLTIIAIVGCEPEPELNNASDNEINSVLREEKNNMTNNKVTNTPQEKVSNTTEKEIDNTPNNSSDSLQKNPFQEEDIPAGALGSIGHGPTMPNRDEQGRIQPFIYEGDEISIPYEVQASGKAKNVGFLIFIDGIAQPYKTDSSGTYDYIHTFNLQEDDVNYPFTFIFEPITGKAGDTLSMSMVSIYAPDFMPDMKQTSGYGNYHDTLSSEYELCFKKDARQTDASALPQYKYIKNVKQSTEPITQDYLDTLSSFAGAVTLETLNKQIFAEQYFDGQGELLNNLKINADGTLHMTFKLVGYPGARYRNTIYINHKALSDGKNTSFETVLTKGNITVIEADIDLAMLEDFNTFYVISTLCNVQEFWEGGMFLLKTPSVLLYK